MKLRNEIKETVHLVADSVNRWRGQRIGHFGLGAIGRIGWFLGADCHFAGQWAHGWWWFRLCIRRIIFRILFLVFVDDDVLVIRSGWRGGWRRPDGRCHGDRTWRKCVAGGSQPLVDGLVSGSFLSSWLPVWRWNPTSQLWRCQPGSHPHNAQPSGSGNHFLEFFFVPKESLSLVPAIKFPDPAHWHADKRATRLTFSVFIIVVSPSSLSLTHEREAKKMAADSQPQKNSNLPPEWLLFIKSPSRFRLCVNIFNLNVE